MKIFARITAGVAILLVLLSVILIVVSLPIQGGIIFFLRYGARPYGYEFFKSYWEVTIPWQALVECFVQLICIAPLIFTACRKNGRPWVEIVWLAAMFIAVPALFSVFKNVDFWVDQFRMAEYRWEELWWFNDFYDIWYSWKIYDMGYYDLGLVRQRIFLEVNDITSWCLVPAYLGRLLAYGACGISLGVCVMGQKKTVKVIPRKIQKM